MSINIKDLSELVECRILNEIFVYINNDTITTKEILEWDWLKPMDILVNRCGYEIQPWECANRHYRKRIGVMITMIHYGDYDDIFNKLVKLAYELDRRGFNKIKISVGLEALNRE